MDVMIVVNRESNLLQITLALRPPRGLPRLLDCWQQQRNQNCNDRNDYEQFNKRKCSRATR